jgi:hypothetical protein
MSRFLAKIAVKTGNFETYFFQKMDWVHVHNRQVKHSGKGVRLLICLLPKKSPWLNSIEPMWIHAKRKIVEPENRLSASEVVSRVCSVFANPVLPFLKKS